MPRNAAGQYILPVGNPVIADTLIESDGWANPTMNDLGAEIEDSLSRDGKGSMRAALGVIDGSEANPGMRFLAETGSGLYRESDGRWWLTVKGVGRILVTETDGAQVIELLSIMRLLGQTTPMLEFRDENGVVMSSFDENGVLQYNQAVQDPISGGGPATLGSVQMWPTEVLPFGFIWADGNSYDTTIYSALFGVYGYRYGGAGASFNVPDYRGYMLRMTDMGAGVDPDAAGRTDRGDGTTGDNVGTVQQDELEAHDHDVIDHVHGLDTTHDHASGGLVNSAVGDHTHTLANDSTPDRKTASDPGSPINTVSGSGGAGVTGADGAHNHTISGNVANDGFIGNVDPGGAQTSSSTGGAETRPKNKYINFIIKT